MQTISTHQTIGLTSTTYAVTTDDGRTIGTYQQGHGADVVTSADLPAEDNGVIGPIEAVAAFTRVAGIKGWRLSDEASTSYSTELLSSVAQRISDHGGIGNVNVSDVFTWGQHYGVSASTMTGVVATLESEPAAA